MQQPALSIVIPAYNEERRLPASLRDIKTFFQAFPLPLEVLVVVERSTDRTLDLAREAAADAAWIEVIDNQVHRGKGYAVKSGMLRAKGEIVLFMDTDLSTPLTEVIAFLSHFNDHPSADVVIGSRAEAKSRVVKKQSWLRRNLGRAFNRFVQGIAMRGITDTQCGFKAFRLRAVRDVFAMQTTDGFAFDVEVLMLAQELGYKIDVKPVHWVNSPDSKVRILLDPLKMLWDLLSMRRRVQRSVRARPLSPSVSAPQPRAPSSAQGS